MRAPGRLSLSAFPCGTASVACSPGNSGARRCRPISSAAGPHPAGETGDYRVHAAAVPRDRQLANPVGLAQWRGRTSLDDVAIGPFGDVGAPLTNNATVNSIAVRGRLNLSSSLSFNGVVASLARARSTLSLYPRPSVRLQSASLATLARSLTSTTRFRARVSSSSGASTTRPPALSSRVRPPRPTTRSTSQKSPPRRSAMKAQSTS